MSLEDFGGAISDGERQGEDKALPCGMSRRKTGVVQPSKSSFMINYRVDNLDELLEQLRADGCGSHPRTPNRTRTASSRDHDPDETRSSSGSRALGRQE